MRAPSSLAALAAVLGLAACTSAHPASVTQVTPVRQMPLPDAMTLLAPAEKNDILGLVYDTDPGDARLLGTLGAALRDNPCADHLVRSAEKVETKIADAWPFSDPVVPQLGFESFRGTSTHLFVIVDSGLATFVEPGPGHAACCAEADCGVGMVTAIYEGTLNLHPAMSLPSSAPPIVLVGSTGDSVGLALHDGRTYQGVVAVELADHPRPTVTTR